MSTKLERREKVKRYIKKHITEETRQSIGHTARCALIYMRDLNTGLLFFISAEPNRSTEKPLIALTEYQGFSHDWIHIKT